MAVWVSLVNNTDSQATILESASSPVLFSEAGQIELSGQFYFVAINVNVEGLRDAIDPIAIALNEIAQGIKEEISNARIITNSELHKQLFPESNGTKHSKLAEILTKTLNDHLEFLTKELEDRHTSLINFLGSLGVSLKRREPRGLIDAGGSILHYLFGTATQAQVDNTNTMVERLNSLSEKEREQLNVHGRILNISSIHIESLETNVKRVMTCLEHVQIDVSKPRGTHYKH